MTRNTTELRDCPQAAFKRSLKDNTGYQYRYTGVTRPLKGTVFLFIDKGGCLGHCHATISLICMSTHKATAARCLSYHQAAYGQPAIWALATAPLRRLALSVLFIQLSRLTATRPLVPSPREPSIKGNTPMQDKELTYQQPRITTLTK